MTVDADVWIWTPACMRRAATSQSIDGYITVPDTERLLEEAHRRGRREGLAAAEAEYNDRRAAHER